MALPRTVTTLDEIDEALHSYYIEGKDGEYVLDIEGVDNVDHLRNAYTKTKEEKKRLAKEAREAKSRLEAFGDIDPETVQELLDLREKVEQDKLTSAGKFEEALSQTKDKYEKALQKARAEAEAQVKAFEEKQGQLMSQLRKVQLVDKAKDSMIRAGISSDNIADVLKLTEDRLDLSEEAEAVVLDEDGTPTGLTLDDFYGKVFKEAKPIFYGSERKAGGGSPTGTSTSRAQDYKGKGPVDKKQLLFGDFDLDAVASGEQVVTVDPT